MAQTRTLSLFLGDTYAGAGARLRARLYSEGAPFGSEINTGFYEVGTEGNFEFRHNYPDGWRGVVEFRDSNTGIGIPDLGLYAINPEEVFPFPGGAYQIVILVRDPDLVGIPGATVRIIGPAFEWVVTTDASGYVYAALDGGTYTFVATAGGYYADPVEFTVSTGNTSITIDMQELPAPPSPGSADQVIGYLDTLDKYGDIKPAVPITFELLRGPGTDGRALFSEPFTEVSDELGRLSVELPRGCTYQAWRGTATDENTMQKEKFRTPTDTTITNFALPELLGYE